MTEGNKTYSDQRKKSENENAEKFQIIKKHGKCVTLACKVKINRNDQE